MRGSDEHPTPPREYDLSFFSLVYSAGKAVELSKFRELPNEIYGLDENGNRISIPVDYCYTFPSNSLPALYSDGG
jgi:hypothetical protein